MFRWPYDGLYFDKDGSLAGLPNATIMRPDGIWNMSTECFPAANFINAIQCPSYLGSWIRFAFNQANLDQNGESLFIYDMSNNVTSVPSLHKRLTHPDGYMMVLQAKKTYTLVFQNANVCIGNLCNFYVLCILIILEFS